MTLGRRLKRGIKSLVKHAARGAPAPGRDPAASVILTYHSVGTRQHEMNVTPAVFRVQMAWLADNCSVQPLKETTQGRSAVTVTFDDGYVDNLRYAAPILESFHMPATVFVVAGKLGGVLSAADDPNNDRLMTADDLIELAHLGIEIGGHTMTHPRLASLSEEQQRIEIMQCKHRLEGILNSRIHSFAYPYGTVADYAPITKRIVQDAGFEVAASNRYGVNVPSTDPFELRRIWIDETDSLDMFKAKVTGQLDVLAALDSNIAVRARRQLNRLFRTA